MRYRKDRDSAENIGIFNFYWELVKNWDLGRIYKNSLNLNHERHFSQNLGKLRGTSEKISDICRTQKFLPQERKFFSLRYRSVPRGATLKYGQILLKGSDSRWKEIFWLWFSIFPPEVLLRYLTKKFFLVGKKNFFWSKKKFSTSFFFTSNVHFDNVIHFRLKISYKCTLEKQPTIVVPIFT